MSATLAGFALSFSLIMAIGAQNAFLLRQGLRGEHVLPMVLTCALSDALLIAVGVAGMAGLVAAIPGLERALTLGGALFLLVYGAFRFRAAWTGGGALDPKGGGLSLNAALATCLAITWLNPHVYLDTVVLVGSVSARFPGEQLAFGLGAVSASLVFFATLGYGAQLLRPMFTHPSAWRVLDASVGATMWLLALGLICG
jgi:L-lysine exporter family protein LysE/ArgO